MLRLMEKIILVLALGVFFASSFFLGQVYANNVKPEIKITTDKEEYKSNEKIKISIEVRNPSSEEISINLGTSLHSDYTIDNIYRWSIGKIVITNKPLVKIPAKTSIIVCSFSYDPNKEGQLSSGAHTIVGEVIKYGSNTKIINIAKNETILTKLELASQDKAKEYVSGQPPAQTDLVTQPQEEETPVGQPPTEQNPATSPQEIQIASAQLANQPISNNQASATTPQIAEQNQLVGVAGFPDNGNNALPSAPTLNPITSPTNLALVNLSGTKDANSSVLLNGTEIVALNPETSWSYQLNLVDGSNTLSLTSKNEEGGESQAYITNIILDRATTITIDPVYSPTNLTRQTISGTKEADATINITTSATSSNLTYPTPTTWQVEISNLSLGNNTIVARAQDTLGNTASASATIMRSKIFTDATTQAGINLTGPNQYMTFGVVMLDYNNDGNLDMYVIEYNTYNVLYRNNGNGTFTDVTAQAGVQATTDVKYTGYAFDYNNDGYEDLLVFPQEKPMILYKNNGNGTFTDVSSIAGLGRVGESDCAIADYDYDGYLDLLIVHAYWMQTLELYHNNGNGTFTNITNQVGFTGHSSPHKAAAAIDYDNDGDLDIYLTGDWYTPGSYLFRNNFKETGVLTFTDVTAETGLNAGTLADSSPAIGDYNNDGHMDIYVPVHGNGPGYIGGPNYLFRNNGDGTFTDVAQTLGVAGNDMGMSAVFLDYDNDGYLDLYVGNYDNSKSKLYHNNGDATFTDATADLGITLQANLHLINSADYNHDGFCDLMRTGNYSDQTALLYKNNTNPNHWIIIRTVGTASNKDGVGAQVKVKVGALEQTRIVSIGSKGKENLELEFGLGNNPRIDSIEIIWPSNKIQTLTNITADQILTITEPAN